MLTAEGIVRKLFVEDEPFIGSIDEQPRQSFQVARDVYDIYYLFGLVMMIFT
jgi:hypothetical protein